MNMNVEMEKRLAVILSKPLDADVGRNEKIRSRLEWFEEKGWDIDIHVIEDPGEGNLLLNFLMIIFRSLMVAMDIISNARKDGKTVIWSMNSPAFLHLPALLVKLLEGDIKWAAEFRDAMCEEPFYSHKSVGRRIMKSLLEGPVVRFTDKVVTVKGSQGSIDYLKNKYPNYREKFEELPYMGYKKDDFENLDKREFDKFTITYAGRFYEDWIEPDVFLKGFVEFVRESDLSTDDIQLRFYCKGWRKKHSDLAKRLDIEKYISISGYLPKEEIFSIMKASDLLLYIHGANNSRKDMIHTKFYDYIGAGRAIFGLAGEDTDVRNVIEKHGLGVVVDENSVEDVKKGLEKIVVRDKEVFVQKESRDLFTRERHDRRFFEILEILHKKNNIQGNKKRSIE